MTTSSPPEYAIMRGPLFRRWLLVWHTLYIGGLLATLGVALWTTFGDLGWREAAMVAIVAILIAAYTRTFVFETRWPYPNWFLILYYTFTIALLAVATWLNPVFIWAVGMLFGQIFGILPPGLALPGGVAVLAVILLASNDWRLPDQFSWANALFIGVQIGGMMLLYLYIYHVFRTSQERAELVNELTAAKEQLELARDAEAELATLRERERVARDLHDGLGHSLVALSMQLEAVQRLYKVDPDRASAMIEEMKGLTLDSMANLRGAIEGLRAPGRGNEPLSVALRELALQTGRGAGAVVTIDLDPAVDDLPPLLAEAVWRVSQEALANIQRHAAARHIELRAAVSPAGLRLLIADDGIGLPPHAEQRPGHYGLRGIRERVEGLGGSLSLESAGGTRLTIELPLVHG